MKTQDILQLVKWFVYICLFAVPFVPLIVSNSLFFPFIVGKGLAFRVFTELALGGWLLLVLFGDMPKPRVTLMRVSMAIFLIIVTLADASGLAPFKSFWSNFERMDGLVTLLHVFAYFMVAGSMLNTHKLWLRFWNLSLTISMVIGLGALGELGKEGVRIAGTTGNPIYLAVYALFHIFIAWLLLYKSRGTAMRLIYGLTIVLNLMVLWYTGTRGALLGLMAGVVVTMLGIAVFGKGLGSRVRNSAIAGLVGLVIVAGSFFMFKDSSFVQSNYMLKRLSEISLTTDAKEGGTGSLRIIVWSMALEGVKERPILGWGQENFNYVFNKHYNPGMHGAEPWYDRTHNIFFDWLIAAGVLGLLAYIAMYLAVFVESVRASYFGTVESTILAGLLVAYGVHNLFVFDHLISYILFFSLAAWIHSVDAIENGNHDTYITEIDTDKVIGMLAIIVIPLVTIYSVYWFNNPSYQQNKLLIKALVSSRNVAHISQTQELFEQASSHKSTGTQEAREQFIQAASRLASSNDINSEQRKAFVSSAISQMQKQAREYPDDARFPHFIGGLHTAYGEHELAKPFLEEALALSPTKISFLIALGNNASLRQDFATAKEYYNKAHELVPNDSRVNQLLQIVNSRAK